MSQRVWVLLAGKAASLASVAEQQKLRVQVAEHLEDAVQKLRHLSSQLACVIFDDQRLLKELKGGAFKQIFCIAVDQAVADDPLLRLAMFDAGARMLAPSMMAAEAALAKVAAVVHDRGVFSCPGCGLEELSENALHLHMQLHHSVDVLKEGPCPICGKKDGNLAVHVHNDHGPPEEREPPHAPFQTFSWCVCRRRDGRFLLVNEPAGISGGRPSFWLPAGRVDRGESLQEACVREALEEAGVRVRVTGLLRLMVDGHGTLRAIFLAEPEDPKDGELCLRRAKSGETLMEGPTAEPKSLPDWESVGAMWVDVKELKKLKESDYRHPDPAELYPQVASGRLKPEPVDTKDFQSLEDLVRRLTLGDLSAEPELNRAWRRVQKSCPASLFQRG